MYKVISPFYDLRDFEESEKGTTYHYYGIGDTYPREGIEATEERISELKSDGNLQGKPLIEEVAEEVAEEVTEAPKAKKTTKKGNKK